MNSEKAIAYFRNIQGVLKLLTILNLTAYQWRKPTCAPDGAKFDFIIVGGGTSGCLIASRLVEGNASVLIVEAGTYPPLESALPGLFPFTRFTENDWNFTSSGQSMNAESHTNNVYHISQGKVLGGSGSMNYGYYVRGYPHDYNTWADITKDPSWSWESVQPLFRKNEKLIDERILESRENHDYGTKGKILIQKKYYKRNRHYFNALEEIGYEYHLDINPKHPLGFTNTMFNIGHGERQSTANKFLSPLKDKKNLHLMLNTLVTKILFDDNKNAIGVEVLTEDNIKKKFYAKKEVIISAGTIKSPQLLMLSGIGPKDHLLKKGIKVISNLPVGKNFQDHVNSNLVYKMTKESLVGNITNPHEFPYIIFDGYVALNKSQRYPDYGMIGFHFGQTLTFLGLCAFYFKYDQTFCDTLGKGLDDKEVFVVFITHLNPKSRGEILLQSTDPNDYPLIFPGYYSNEIDIEKHASYLADFNRVLDSTYFRKVKAKLIDPKIKKCDGLKRGTMEYWRCHAVGTSDTAHYVVGTCAMGTVVDSKLRVHGVKKLRVADASVMPENVRSFTQATVMMIARKVSDMIIKEYGLKLKKSKKSN